MVKMSDCFTFIGFTIMFLVYSWFERTDAYNYCHAATGRCSGRVSVSPSLRHWAQLSTIMEQSQNLT